MAMGILREKVPISRILWLAVAIVVAAFLANSVIVRKGEDVMRVYDCWLLLFSGDTYAGQSLIDIFASVGMVAYVTVVLIAISLGVGWLTAAIVGSLAVLIRKRT